MHLKVKYTRKLGWFLWERELLWQLSRRPGDKIVLWRHPGGTASETSIFSPSSQKVLSFSPLKSIPPPTQRGRTSGKFKQECKLRDVYRKTEIDCIKWQPVWSPGRSSTQTFPLRAKQPLFTVIPCMGCWVQESDFQWLTATGQPLGGLRVHFSLSLLLK